MTPKPTGPTFYQIALALLCLYLVGKYAPRGVYLVGLIAVGALVLQPTTANAVRGLFGFIANPTGDKPK